MSQPEIEIKDNEVVEPIAWTQADLLETMRKQVQELRERQGTTIERMFKAEEKIQVLQNRVQSATFIIVLLCLTIVISITTTIANNWDTIVSALQ